MFLEFELFLHICMFVHAISYNFLLKSCAKKGSYISVVLYSGCLDLYFGCAGGVRSGWVRDRAGGGWAGWVRSSSASSSSSSSCSSVSLPPLQDACCMSLGKSATCIRQHLII